MASYALRSLVEHVAAVADLEAAPRVLLDHHDRGAGVVDQLDPVEYLVLEQRRQAGRGFVEQQHRRLDHQRPSHREHLALAARERCPRGWRRRRASSGTMP